jgi:hypothetical protein
MRSRSVFGLLSLAALSAPGVASPVAMPVRYQVDIREFRRNTVAGTILTIEFFDSGTCPGVPFVSDTVNVDDVKLVAKVRPVRITGGPTTPTFVAELQFNTSVFFPETWVKVSGPGIVPFGSPCQLQHSQAFTSEDSARLGGIDASRYPTTCGPDTINGGVNTVKGSASIDGASAAGSLGTAGITSSFVCNGEGVLVRRAAPGVYYVVFDDGGSDLDTIGANFGDRAVVSVKDPGIIASVDGIFQCASSPPPFHLCYIVETRDTAGANVDARFVISLH